MAGGAAGRCDRCEAGKSSAGEDHATIATGGAGRPARLSESCLWPLRPWFGGTRDECPAVG